MSNTKQNNRRETSLIIIQIAALIGFLDSLYLTYIKVFNAPIYCTPGLGDCDVVNASRYSILFGIPLAVYGMIGFGLVFLITLLDKEHTFIAEYQNLMLFGISFAGFLFSLYLTYLEAFVIRAFCQWCVLSAIAMTVIFITTIVRLVVKSPSNKH
ncbi:MAG: vitamin K epoxide reductase family protein [Anaerolineaceae bacterium]|nr:vitamin K epoxide reductase family protein [Anaerolineaceae bacterium]